MGAYTGPKTNMDDIGTLFDLANIKCIGTSSTNFKLANMKNRSTDDVSINPGVFDGVNNSLSLDGVDDVESIPKNSYNKFKWGSTLSIYCKPTYGSYILNDTNSNILYFSKSGQVSMLLSPDLSKNVSAPTQVLMDTDNTIYLLHNGSNTCAGANIFDIDGNLIDSLKSTSYSITYTYGYGKMLNVDGTFYNSSYGGWSWRTNFFDFSGYSHIYNGSSIYTYQGDIDIDGGYIYLTGEYYLEKAFKVELANPTNIVSYGTGTPGSGTDTFNNPRSISVGTSHVFVIDRSNHRVMVLNKSDMTYNSNFGSLGSGTTEFNNPRGCIIRNGKLYICDTSNGRIKIYNESTHAYIESISLSIYPHDISLNDDYAAILDGGNLYVYEIVGWTLLFSKIFAYPTNATPLYGAKGVGTDGTDFYIGDRANRMYKVDGTTLDITKLANRTGTDIYSITADSSYYYTAGGNYGHIVEKRDKTTPSTLIASTIQGSGDGETSDPWCVVVDSTYVYVADTLNYRIQRLLKSDLSYVSQFGSYGIDANNGSLLSAVYGIAIDSTYLYVGDYSAACVKIYDLATLTFQESFSAPQPYRVSVDSSYIYTNYYGTVRIYDKTTHVLVNTKVYSNGSDVYGSFRSISGSFNVIGDHIIILDNNKIVILDRETLEIAFEYNGWGQTNIILNKFTEERMLIDIVFTSDYKTKIICNGVESNIKQWDSSETFQSIKDYKIGNIADKFSQMLLYSMNWFDIERTASENPEDLISLKKRKKRK